MKRSVACLAALWLGAFAITVTVEWFLGQRATGLDVVWAGVFLPITAVVGGRAAFGSSFFASAFLGLAFWPVWIALARRWIKNGPSLGLGVALELWMLVGFAQPLARFGLVMSA